MLTHSLVFLLSFLSTEGAAWLLHKYVMHGSLWILHEDHHRPTRTRWWQRNDLFAIFFAIPSFLLILLGTYFLDPHLASAGYGVMAYGAVYFFVHEVLIHRRLPIHIKENAYLRALRKAHHDHHAIVEKEGCRNFGMLIVPLRYFLTPAEKTTDPR